jgi:hypothetical protein
MAGKSLNILRIDRNRKTAWCNFTPSGQEYEYAFNRLSRNTLIKVVGALGHRFVGRTPLSYTADELAKLAISLCADGGTDIHVSSKPTVPSVPAPTVTVPAKPVMVDAVGIESALRNVINAALEGYTESGVDKEVVEGIVSHAIARHSASVDAKISELTKVIAETKPTVKHVTLTGGEVRKVEGRTHFMFDKVLRVVDAGMSPWITGTAGVGKTMLAEQIATALGLEYSPESFCSQSSKAEIKGYKDGHGLYQSVDFRKRFEDGGVYLLVEIDAANPNILLTLNSALSNGWMMFPDGKVKRHEKFVAIASANTYGNGATAEYVGRQVIDGSTLNRFVKIDMPIDEIMEAGIVGDLSRDGDAGRVWLEIVRRARANVATNGLKVIISPRDSYHGAKLLNAGFTFQECVPMTFGSGMKSEQYAKVMAGITIPSGGAKE